MCAAMQQIQKQKASQEQERRKRAAEDVAKRAPAKKLALTLLKRGWKIGRPQLHIGLHLRNDEHWR